MSTPEQTSDSASDVVERGETYRHEEHGRVEVTAIWRRTQPLDVVSDPDERELVVVRYRPAGDGTWIDELAEPLADFLEATR